LLDYAENERILLLVHDAPGRRRLEFGKGFTMTTIQVKRDQIQATAKNFVRDNGGKMLPLRGCNSLGKTRGIAIIPADVRGSQIAINQAVAIITES
jgi:hypothetical protein